MALNFKRPYPRKEDNYSETLPTAFSNRKKQLFILGIITVLWKSQHPGLYGTALSLQGSKGKIGKDQL